MFRPILAAAAAALLLTACSQSFGPRATSTSTVPATASERIAGPDCRQHCEREYRVCMDSSAPQRGSEERQNRLFGPGFDCQERLNACYRRCAPVQ